MRGLNGELAIKYISGPIESKAILRFEVRFFRLRMGLLLTVTMVFRATSSFYRETATRLKFAYGHYSSNSLIGRLYIDSEMRYVENARNFHSRNIPIKGPETERLRIRSLVRKKLDNAPGISGGYFRLGGGYAQVGRCCAWLEGLGGLVFLSRVDGF